jgi:hypothetical protein
LKILEIYLPLEISARDLDDKMLWEILCHASVEQGYIESSCRVLNDAPSGNTVRAHLIEALGVGIASSVNAKASPRSLQENILDPFFLLTR